MKKQEILLKSLVNAAGVLAYVAGVAWLLSSAKTIFAEPKGVIIPVFMLLLLIVSATITGLLVLGKPAYLYFGGAKKEALTLLFFTLGWLIIFLAAVAATLILLK